VVAVEDKNAAHTRYPLAEALGVRLLSPGVRELLVVGDPGRSARAFSETGS